MIGLIYYVLASSQILGEALERAARYSTLANEGIRLIVRDGKEFGVSSEHVGVPRHSDRHQIEFWFAAIARTCRHLTNRHLPATRVAFAHARKAPAQMNKFFGCEVVFGARSDELMFAPSIREAAITSADPYLNDLLVRYCEEAIADRQSHRSSFDVRVENAIVQLLPHGKAQAGEIGKTLGVSKRTLARRLASEGLTFAGVLQRLRLDLAERHLRDEDLSISNIAWLLGYKDVSAFTNAFKRWTGKAPRLARDQRQSSASLRAPAASG
jgi:AraC-like DNA-binding protein